MAQEQTEEWEDEDVTELVRSRPTVLVNNPVGPLPNVRLRYLPEEVVEAYEASAVREALRDRHGRIFPRIGAMAVWLTRNRTRRALPAHLKQTGLVDRFADKPYGARNW
jgi:hypothetical protein